jgi:CBS domain-containing protein
MSPTVSDIMRREVYAVAATTSLEACARLFSSRHISGAPVIEPDGKAVGVVTQNDLIDPDRRRSGQLGTDACYTVRDGVAQAHHGAPATSAGTVADVMTAFVVSVAPDTPVVTAARLMMADSIHRVLVLDGQRLVGIVTSMDLVRGLLPPP